jgi:Activator of Hsp90 ATPase homolog 1-like protein
MTVHTRSIENFACEDAVCCKTIVPISAAAAFEKFRHDITAWWPREFTWSGDALESLYFEGRKQGVLWERGPEGFRIDIARVMRWVPPERMVLRWHVGPNKMPEPNPARASEVEIKFIPEEPQRTRIELEHRFFSRHGAGAESYRALMGGAKGWPTILKAFADRCAPASVRNLHPAALTIAAE